MRNIPLIYFLYASIVLISFVESKQNAKANSVEEIADVKDFKKILRTKNNVLALFYSSQKEAINIIKTFREAAETIRGQGTMLLIDCSGDNKKICKKLKVTPEPYVLRHYKDGEFHKVYDRKETATSMVSFMRDPTGDIPWEEESSLGDVLHIPDYPSLVKLLRKEMKPLLIMFYAPWCGFCKQLKPEYSAAATSLKGKAILAAIDVNRPENSVVRSKFNITGFPTLLYFEKGELKLMYEGDNKKDDLIRFMNDPSAPPPKPKEEDWSLADNDVVHLTAETFPTVIKEKKSVLVMFYAPWCGHCKKMKPEYEKAATALLNSNVDGVLAAVDATKEKALGKEYGVKGYPTIKYFKDGEFVWDVPTLREADKIVNYMKNPQEPPPPPPPQPNWEDEPSEVIFLTVENFKQTLRKKRHALVMFYAPWCGHCKMAKPEFQAAAEELKDNLKIAFAALDCTKHNTICSMIGVEGYPTFKYFNYYDKARKDYTGDRKKADFINYMLAVEGSGKTGQSTEVPKDEPPTPETKSFWNGLPGSENIVQLSDANFKDKIKNTKSLFIMVHDRAPASQNLKTVFVEAAKDTLPTLATFASYDATSNKQLIKDYKITSFPSLKLFKAGKLKSDYPGSLEKNSILNFLRKTTKDEL